MPDVRKASDISDLDFLAAVDAVQRAQGEKPHAQGWDELPWACWGYDNPTPEDHAEYGPWVRNDHFPDVPLKLLKAKGRRVIDRGLMMGCMCGCRGDMELTEAGRALLRAAQSVAR